MPPVNRYEVRRLIMMTTPDSAGPATAGPETPGWDIPADDVADEDVDVLSLAGQRPPAGGAWLWVTIADARRGGEFTALFLPRTRPRACGGDVLLHIAPGTSQAEEHWPGPTVRVQVRAAVAGSLVPSQAGTTSALACGQRPSAARPPSPWAS
jgi:hypothetical protein